MSEKHLPVMLRECLTGLQIRPDGVYVDGTLGRAGHSMEIAKQLTTGKLIAIDQDETAILAGREKLAPFGARVSLHHGNFRALSSILEGQLVDGMLFDLGVSSPQLDNPERGFSYMHDAVLDMRMDQSAHLSAHEVVNTWDEYRLREILQVYGEEKFAGRIAKKIVERRAAREIARTGELVEVIKSAMPAAALREKGHPAKRSFQAIRIAVNDELAAVEEMLDAAVSALRPGGRLLVISFHSLEDRLVKQAMQRATSGCTCPRDFPVCICGFRPSLKIIKPAPVIAGADELLENPRARSAKLRIAERL